MEALLMANQPATEAMAAELAAQRSHAIQSYLAAQSFPRRAPLPGRPKTGSRVGCPGRVEPGDAVRSSPESPAARPPSRCAGTPRRMGWIRRLRGRARPA